MAWVDPAAPDRGRRPESLLQFLRSLRGWQFEVASRAAVSVAVPLAVLASVGRLDWAAYAAFGAMTSLYGRNEPYRQRMRTVTAAGLLMLAIIAFALTLANFGAGLLALTGGLVLVLTVSIVLCRTLGLFPGTPIFFVFGYAVVAEIAVPAEEFGPRLLVAVAGASVAWALTMSGWLLRRLAGRREPALFKELSRAATVRPRAVADPQVWLNVAQNVIGALLAGALAMSFGLGHAYWAVIAVVAVLPPPHAAHSVSRAFHRIIGTVLGLGVAGLVLLPDPPVWVLILVIAVAQFGAELFIGRHYGAALLFVTPLALTVVHLVSPEPVATLLVDRVLETTLGGVVALGIVLLVQAAQRRRLRSA
ncbi:FUSC family protein [Cryobacterium melibiosiphilum]|uniref:FUSC family protein n=1 Tax=Cryobacterium melibiosiphilum TaxID=995039 RepID=A0A3A5MX07_9MICO|nr:FUSC family protein [Cryobacterium melibiosiphilum]RJT90546.1 FUSC family protein [Cryobacterium melibiosiphilum]